MAGVLIPILQMHPRGPAKWCVQHQPATRAGPESHSGDSSTNSAPVWPPPPLVPGFSSLSSVLQPLGGSPWSTLDTRGASSLEPPSLPGGSRSFLRARAGAWSAPPQGSTNSGGQCVPACSPPGRALAHSNTLATYTRARGPTESSMQATISV